MVDVSSSEVISVQVSKRTLSGKKENIFKWFLQRIEVLNELKLELDSCREIIRVLQEEFREISPSIQPTWNKVNEDCEDKGSYNTLTSEEWTSFSSNRRRNLLYTRRNFQQLHLQTSNRFETLASLNEDIEFLNTFTAIVDLSRFNNSCLKSPASTLVDLTFQSRALRSFSLNQLRNLSL